MSGILFYKSNTGCWKNAIKPFSGQYKLVWNTGMGFFCHIYCKYLAGNRILDDLYIAGLQTIPKDVLEAAKLDGCVGLKKFVILKFHY